MRRAKIVCTLGPVSSSEGAILALVEAGMDVARLNLSHGTYSDHEQAYHAVRRASDRTGRSVAVLADLQGPKIRLGSFAAGPVAMAAGDEITITTEDVPGDATIVSTTYQGLPGDVSRGDRILVDDGRVGLEVVSVDGPRVRVRCTEPGTLSNQKGLNLPGVSVSAPALTSKDEADLRWALRLRADWVALSFVRSANDIARARQIMAEEKVSLPVLAKVEKPEAVEQLDEVVSAFDGIMVARGDLGVELPLEQVPLVQRRAVAMSRDASKPVIVATQMLESMIEAPRPTRAEASDVANAVLEGADAVMLSGETSVGKHAIEAVRTMGRITEVAESDGLAALHPLQAIPRTKGGAIARAAAEVGRVVGARFLVAFTQTGDSARRLARYRSPIPLLAFTPEPAVRSQLALTWGVEAFLVPYVEHTDEMVRQVDAALLKDGRCTRGDLVVIVAGSPPGIPGSTNAMRVHRIGDAVSAAAPGYDAPEG